MNIVLGYEQARGSAGLYTCPTRLLQITKTMAHGSCLYRHMALSTLAIFDTWYHIKRSRKTLDPVDPDTIHLYNTTNVLVVQVDNYLYGGTTKILSRFKAFLRVQFWFRSTESCCDDIIEAHLSQNESDSYYLRLTLRKDLLKGMQQKRNALV